MNSIKARGITAYEITAYERRLDQSKFCEMMATNMKRLPPTSTGFKITGLEIVTDPFEAEVQP